jgi:acetyltransferase-like isoleucine patch superfamily enzyme
MRSYLIQLLFSLLPDTRGFRFKAWLLRRRGFQIGYSVKVASSAKFKLKCLSVGDNTYINCETFIGGGDATVQIGRDVDIAPRCMIVTGTHRLGEASHRAGKGVSRDIVIGDGTWIGANSTILGGVHIGQGCVIAAGSVVRENLEDNCLFISLPKRVKRQLP